MAPKYTEETEAKLNKSLDEVGRKDRKEKKDKQQKKDKKDRKEQPKKDKLKEKKISKKVVISGSTMRKLFSAAGKTNDIDEFPSINVTLSIKKK
ncbi:hypothetical protein TVAGG3_0420980 [Trichomonas vaginalis G3]|nr:hypothetical protein TVAGG3_0420980 [Trichomonas vaginalis G3]KAI5536051.1 hypothetical protein TVAGG3_0420980 [Trichomonas vaginalis G3]